MATHSWSIINDRLLGGSLFSVLLWERIHLRMAECWPVGKIAAGVFLLWPLGAAAQRVGHGTAWRVGLCRGSWAMAPLLLLGVFELLWSVAAGLGRPWVAIVAASTPLVHGFVLGAWLAALLALSRPPLDARWAGLILGGAIVLFAITFTSLAALQYRALMVPHGDSAMYEEHLWNVLHGKGFRSQLDGGRLFLGEHLEIIHLFLVPLYALYPHLVTLNLCQSVALGLGALPIAWMARRRTGSAWAGCALGLTYLLYDPLQYLDLELSLKTFRPETLGVPLLLFALDALDRERYRRMLGLLGLTLLAKEDYAAVVAMLGLWIAGWGLVGLWKSGRAARSWRDDAPASAPGRTILWGRVLGGLGLAAAAGLYLVFVVEVWIPGFRGGAPHYTAYFKSLGATPAQILATVVQHPRAVLAHLANGENLLLALHLLAPLGFLPLFAPDCFAVLLPNLAVIMLNELPDARTPYFHFHAPLIPILFWAAAQGMGRIGGGRRPAGSNEEKSTGSEAAESPRPNFPQLPSHPTTSCLLPFISCLPLFASLVSGFWLGKSPLAERFYDPGRGLGGAWKVLYVAGPRTADLERHVLPLIPRSARVAAPDYILPRFTHYRAAYDYAGGLRPHVPLGAVDWFVIDLRGPYGGSPRIAEVERDPERYRTVYRSAWF